MKVLLLYIVCLVFFPQGHLEEAIFRTSVPLDPQASMNAAEGFLLLLLNTHMVAAAKTILDCTPLSSVQEAGRVVGMAKIAVLPAANFGGLNQSLYATTFLAYGGRGKACGVCLAPDHSKEE